MADMSNDVTQVRGGGQGYGQQPGYAPLPWSAAYPAQPGYGPSGYGMGYGWQPGAAPAQPAASPAQPIYGPVAYSPPTAQPDQRAGMAIAGLVLGIISVLAAILPICGVPFAIAGIVFSALGRRSLSRRTMATVGLVLSIIAAVLALINAAAGVYVSMR